MDVKKLIEVAHASPTAELMFTGWALRERHRSITDVRRHKTVIRRELGSTFNEADFYAAYAGLVQADVGVVSYSLRGHPKYFKWGVPVQQVGRIALQSGRSAEDDQRPTRPHRSAPQRPHVRHSRPALRSHEARREDEPGATAYVGLTTGDVVTVTVSGPNATPDGIQRICRRILRDEKGAA